MLRALLCTSLVLVATTMAAPGWGQSAEEQFAKGQALYDQGKFEDALPLFEGAYAVSGSPNARLMIARSLARLESYALAYEEMKATVEDAAARAKEEPRYEQTRDAAAAELVLLEPKIAKLIIAVPEELGAVTVSLNGTELPDGKIGVPIAVEPGAVALRARSKDGEMTRELSLEAGATRTVTITFARDTAAAPVEPGEPDGGSFEIDAVRGAGIAVAILGAGGLVAFAVTGSMARSKNDQLERECGGVRCTDPAYADVVDEGKRLQLGANVAAGIGAGLLAAGALMFIIGGPDDGDGVAAAPLPGGGFVGWRSRF